MMAALGASIIVAVLAVIGGVALAALGQLTSPLVIVGVPLAVFWLVAVLSRPVWAVGLVCVALPVSLNYIGPITVIDFAVAVTVGAVTLAVLLRRTHVRLAVPALGWGLALIAAAIVAVPGAIDVGMATTRVIALVGGLLLAAAILAACRQMIDIRLVVIVFLGVGLVMTPIAFSNLSALKAVAGGLVVRNRARGVFGDPNELGSYAVILLMVSLGVLLAKTERWLRFLAGVVAALAAGALVASLSRGSWIGAIFGLLGLVILLPERRRALLGVLAGGMLLGLAIGVFQPSSPTLVVIKERVGAITQSTSSPYDDRPQIWAEAIREISARPWFGYGPANFLLASAKRGSQSRQIGAEHAHDVLLTVGAEAGLPAVGFLVGMTIAVAYATRRAMRRLRGTPNAAIVAGIGAALFGEMGHGLIDNTTGNPMLLAILWTLVGLVLAADRITADAPARSRAGGRGSMPRVVALPSATVSSVGPRHV
jgi:putative inorganic carbon (hco3(-)) transporter